MICSSCCSPHRLSLKLTCITEPCTCTPTNRGWIICIGVPRSCRSRNCNGKRPWLQARYHEGLFAAVAEHAKGRIAEFDNFDLSQLLWSFAKVSPTAFTVDANGVLSSGFVARLEGTDRSSQVSELLPSVIEVWWRDANLLGEAAQDMLFGPKNRLKRMCAQDLGCVLWAFAMLQWPDEALFQGFGSGCPGAVWHSKAARHRECRLGTRHVEPNGCKHCQDDSRSCAAPAWRFLWT